MKVLVGIPSFRRPDLLATLLASIEHQECLEGIALSVVVADNDPSLHEAADLCATMQKKFAHELAAVVTEVRGISAARNRLLAEARARGSDFLAMIDDDEIASPQWLANLFKAQRSYGADVVGGPVLFAFPCSPAPALAASGAFPLKRRASGSIDHLDASGNVLLDCASLATIGWPQFDLQFGLSGGEDREFFGRLKGHGLSFAWADDALVSETVSAERMTTPSILRRAFSVGSAEYRIDRLHAAPSTLAGHLVRAVIVLAASLPLAPALLLSRYRLWLLRRYARALGKLSSAFGLQDNRYAVAS